MTSTRTAVTGGRSRSASRARRDSGSSAGFAEKLSRSLGRLKPDGDTVIISSVYAAAWWMMLVNGGRYWDDWCFVRLPLPDTSLMGNMLGQVWQPLYWMMLSWVPGANYIAHWLTFALFLASALWLNRTLRSIPGLGRGAQVLIPALFAVFPVNSARFAHINFQYTASVAAFYYATYLVARDLEEPRLARRMLVGLLFFAALVTTNSLMAFIALVPMYVLVAQRHQLKVAGTVPALLRRYGFVLALPFIVLWVRNTYLSPWGLYAEYNVLKSEGVGAAWSQLPDAARASLWAPLAAPTLWALVVAVVLFLLLAFRARLDVEGSVLQQLSILGFGVTAFVLSVFPYLAVGKFPQAIGPQSWDSRHQVLVPLGAALIVYALAGLLGRIPRLGRTLALALISLVLGISIVADLNVSVAYQADWYKQLSLQAQMKRTRAFRTENIFSFTDKTLAYNVYGRRYQFYEYNGMMYSVFGDASRLGTDESVKGTWGILMQDYLRYRQYHHWELSPPYRAISIVVSPGTQDVTRPRIMWSLLMHQLLTPREFERRVRGVVHLESEPL